MIHKTNDYSLFKLSNFNRKVTEQRKMVIMQSILTKDLTMDRPILIDKEFYIIDGQGRFEACKELKLPIFYTVAEKSNMHDVPLLNVQPSWNSEDYLNHYCQKGLSDYIESKRLMEIYNIKTVATFLKLINEVTHTNVSNRNAGFGGDSLSIFKAGKFILPKNIELLIKDRCYKLDILSVYDKSNNKFRESFIYLVKHIEFHNKDFDWNLFAEKILKVSAKTLYQWRTAQDLMYKVQDDYNYDLMKKNRIVIIY